MNTVQVTKNTFLKKNKRKNAQQSFERDLMTALHKNERLSVFNNSQAVAK